MKPVETQLIRLLSYQDEIGLGFHSKTCFKPISMCNGCKTALVALSECSSHDDSALGVS